MNEIGEAGFPGRDWQRGEPEELGFDVGKLARVGRWLEENSRGRAYRAMVVRDGRVAARWHGGCEPDEPYRMASAAKSVFSCMLGIAVAEGVITSPDARVVDYYPEMMDVPDGFGPKAGRFAREKDREITFRQLISNTSGYLKPDEPPGKVYHYQTFGMNVLCHAIATAYGYYDSSNPEKGPGFGKLIEQKIRDPIGASWRWEYMNFAHPPEARINIFGNYTQLIPSIGDMARLGWLWLNEGRWRDRQVVPAEWIRQSSKVAPDIRTNCPKEEWVYGQGFWTNEFQLIWPSLPADSYAAHGAGGMLIWVCPSLRLVVVEAPGLYMRKEEEDAGLLQGVVEACMA